MIRLKVQPQSNLEKSIQKTLETLKSISLPEHQSKQIEDLLTSITESKVINLSVSATHGPCYTFYLQGKAFNAEFLPLKYSNIKLLVKSSQRINELDLPNVYKKEVKFTYHNRWVACLISQNMISFTLEDIITEFRSSGIEALPFEFVVMVLVNSLHILNNLQEKLGFIKTLSLKSICFQVIYEENSMVLTSFFDVINSDFLIDFLPGSRSKFASRQENILSSIVEVVYQCLVLKNNEELTNISSSSFQVLLKNLSFYPGLSKILEFFLKSSESFAFIHKKFNKLLKTWEFLLSDSLLPSSFSLSGLYSSFYFTDDSIKQKSLSILSKPNSSMLKFPETFIKKNVHMRFFSYLNSLPKLETQTSNFLLKLLDVLSEQKFFRTSENLLSLAYIVSKVDFRSIDPELKETMKKRIKFLVSSKTLTTLSFFHKKNILSSLIMQEVQEISSFLKFSPFVGPQAMDFIEDLHKKNFFPIKSEVFFFIKSIPLQFKLTKTLQITNFINTLFENYFPIDENLDMNDYFGFNIIYELLHGAKAAKTANFQGLCHKNERNYNVSPAMVECLTCDLVFCLTCGQAHENLRHKTNYLTYFAVKGQICNSLSSAGLPSDPASFIPIFKDFELISKLKKDFLLMFEGKKLPGGKSAKEKINLDAFEFNEIPCCYYTEFFFEDLTSEDFEVHIRGTGVVFQNTQEELFKDSVSVGKMPRIGIYDTLGVGIFATKHVFFTYNGFHLRKFISFTQSSVHIQILFKNFPELPKVQRLSKNHLFIGESFDYLEKSLCPMYKNIVNRFRSVLKIVNKKYEKTELHPCKVIFDIEALFTAKAPKSVIQVKRNKDCRVI